MLDVTHLLSGGGGYYTVPHTGLAWYLPVVVLHRVMVVISCSQLGELPPGTLYGEEYQNLD